MRRQWSHRTRSVLTKRSSRSKSKSIKSTWLRSKAQITKRQRSSSKTPRLSRGFWTGVNRVSRKRGKYSSKESTKRSNKWPLWPLNIWLSLWACTKMLLVQMNFIIKLSNLPQILIRRHSNIHQLCKIKRLRYSKVPRILDSIRVGKSQESFRIKTLMSKRWVALPRFKSQMIVLRLRKECFNRLTINLLKGLHNKTTLKIQLTQMLVAFLLQIQWCTKLACKKRYLLLLEEVTWLMRNFTKCSEKEWNSWRKASQSRFNSSSSNLSKS